MEKPADVRETLMLKMIEGEISKAERKELEALLEASAENREMYTQLENLWTITQARVDVDQLDLARGWDAVVARTINAPGTSRLTTDRASVPGMRKIRVRRAGWVAAGILGLMALWFVQPFATQEQVVETAFGETMHVTLPDGSTATLNGGTRMAYPATFDGATRTIQLDGEAFFDVTSVEIPFIVESGQARVRVLGTQFNVRTVAGHTSVAVREGRVQLQPATGVDGLILEANQAGSLTQSGALVRNNTVGIEEGIDWLDGKMVFAKSSFDAVIEEFHRSMGVNIVLMDGVDAATTVSGTFITSNPDIAIAALCTLAQCESRYEDGVYYLQPVQ